MKATLFRSSLRLTVTLLLALTPVAAPAIVVETFETEPDWDKWAVEGTTYWEETYSAVFLTDAGDQAGSFFWYEKMSAETFNVEFDFWIGAGSGADGMTFAWVKGPTILGGGGGSLGFYGGCDGYAVKFDTYSGGGGEPENYVAIVEGSQDNNSTGFAYYVPPIDMEDTYTAGGLPATFHAKIKFHNGHLDMWMSNETAATPMPETQIFDFDIPGYTPYDAYFGFTGATGGSDNVHAFTSLTINKGAYAGEDKVVWAGDPVTLDGSASYNASSYHWHQIGGEPEVVLDNANPADGLSHFTAPDLDIGAVLTFQLDIESPDGPSSDIVDITIRAKNAPKISPANLRTIRTDRGFWLFWDGIVDADWYVIEMEYMADVWVPIAPKVEALEYEMKDQNAGAVLPVRVLAKNSYGTGPASEPVSMTIMRNVAKAEANGGATPPSASFNFDGNPVSGMNNEDFLDHSDSEGTAAETGDFWGYTWDEPLWFDEIAYYTGAISFDGGWFTDLTVEYTEDGATWKEAPYININPAYDLTDTPAGREAFTKYTITFAAVRGTGIRIFGTPGGTGTYTSIAELQVYGDETRGDLVAQGMDAEVPEGTVATLDGSYCVSLVGEITSYSWTGPGGVEVENPNNAIATFTAPIVDEDTVLVFSLTVEDDKGNSATDDDVRITVKDVVTTAVAGVDQVAEEGTVVSLDGTGSLSATGNITYSWSQTAGPDVTLTNPDAAVCSFTAPEIWPFVEQLSFRLQVNDGVDTNSDDVKVRVMNSVFKVKPLGAGYIQDVLLLGQDYCSRILSDDIDGDQLAVVGGEANQNPRPGDIVDLSGTSYRASETPLVWTVMHRDDGLWFDRDTGGCAYDNFIGYIHVYVISPEQRDARAIYMHDDDLRCWNNGALAFSQGGSGSGARNFTLYEGVNSMTFKLHESGGNNYLAVRLTDRDNVPYTDLYYSPSIPNPLPQAYAVRSLPVWYQSPGTVTVEVSMRANPENLPGTIIVSETIPEGVTVADAGGGDVSGQTIEWTLGSVSSATISYTLNVSAGTTAGLEFTGDVNGEGLLGDSAVYAVPTEPLYVTLDMTLGARLVWSPPPEEGADTYRVYRSVDGGDWEEVGFTRETFYTEGVVEGSTYSYKVMAVNKNGVEGAFCDATDAMTVTVPTVVEAENYNYGGGVYPGYRECPAANEAPDSATVGTPEEYDFFYANDIPVDDTRRSYRPNDNCGMQEDRVTANIGWITVGDWWRYTLDVPEPGPEDPPDGWARVGLLVASTGTCELYWDEGLVGTVSFATGGSDDFRWYVLEDAFRTTPGEHTLRVKLVSGAMDIDTIGLGFNLKISRKAIFEDDFEGYTNLYDWNDLETVGNWDVINGSGESDVGWRLWNTAGNYLGDETEDRNPAIAGMTGNYVITDSDLVGTADLDEELVTPDIDCTEWIRLKLDFSKNFRVYPDDAEHSQIAEVDIREVGGDWVNLLSYNVNSIDPNLDPAVDSSPAKLDLSAYDGETFQLRWRFYDASWDWWFAIDNVMVSGEPKPTEVIKGVIKSVSIAAGNLNLTWSEFGPGTYYIEGSFDLLTWHELAGPLTGASSPPILMSGSGAFYRVRSE